MPSSPCQSRLSCQSLLERNFTERHVTFQSLPKSEERCLADPLKAIAIHHVAVQTQDLDRALAFYVGILGAELLSRRAFKRREMAWLRVGETRIELFSARSGEQLSAWTDFVPGPVHLAFSVRDLDAFLQQALSAGARFHPSHPGVFVPPAPGAGPMAYLLGPDGEEVEIRGEEDD